MASEKVVWGYIVQIATGLKTIHDQNLACRVMDLSTLLVTSDRRIRLNCCGIMDVIAPMGEQRIPMEKLRDLTNFGRYMLCIAAGTQEALHDPSRWIDQIIQRKTGESRRCIIVFDQSGTEHNSQHQRISHAHL